MIPKRILSALLSSVSAGVVPRTGAAYLAIGRHAEMQALCRDLSLISQGGASMRFLIGKYGSGKSFLMQLLRGHALEQGYLCADCDLSPERRLCASNGGGLATYRELMRNLSEKTAPEGGALPVVLAKWFSALQSEAAAAGYAPASEAFAKEVSRSIFVVLQQLQTQIGGFDFGAVLSAYYRADRDGDDETCAAALRWLRGETRTRSEAKASLGVNAVIGDDNWYDYLKLWAVFFTAIGYRGLVIMIDECVNLYKIANRQSRENNYEKILSMFNDTLQGKAQNLMLLLGGTPRFLEDERRGLYSYDALKSRLCDDRFSASGYADMLSPVIRLKRLSDDELLALVQRMARLHGEYYGWQVRLSDAQLADFVSLCLSRAGADSMITPREILRDFCAVLNLLYQNPEATYESIVQKTVTLSHAPAKAMTPPVQDVAAQADKPRQASAVTFADLDF